MKPTVNNYRRVILSLIQFEVELAAVNSARQATIITSPKLKVRTQRKDENTLVGIENNRPGIRHKIREKFMQSFFRMNKGTENIGLGLYITNDIVNHIRVEKNKSM